MNNNHPISAEQLERVRLAAQLQRPAVSQEQAAQAQIQQMYLGVFFSLVPVVAADELRRLHDADGWKATDPPGIDTARIVDTANQIAVAAIMKIGITVEG